MRDIFADNELRKTRAAILAALFIIDDLTNMPFVTYESTLMSTKFRTIGLATSKPGAFRHSTKYRRYEMY
jgi:hypothetical protein